MGAPRDGGQPQARGVAGPARVAYAEFARSIGLGGRRIESADEVGPAWDEALAADRPFVLDAVVDPNVPPLPPHIEFAQAKAMTAALLKGDPGARGVVRQSLLDKLAELLPSRSR